MEKRFIKVVAVGYFEIRKEHLKESYGDATTFEEALEKLQTWHDEDPYVSFDEIIDTELPITVDFELMSEGFDPNV